MFSTLREFIESRMPLAEAVDTQADQQHRIHLTTAALLVEVMRADFDEGPRERAAIVLLMKQVFALDDEATSELLQQAEQQADHSTSLYDFTRLVNDTHSAEQKLRIIELMWQVAYADGHLDKYEDHLIRKVADLIHVPHSDFIRSKHKAQGSPLAQ